MPMRTLAPFLTPFFRETSKPTVHSLNLPPLAKAASGKLLSPSSNVSEGVPEGGCGRIRMPKALPTSEVSRRSLRPLANCCNVYRPACPSCSVKSAETPLKTIRTSLTSTPVNAVVSVSPEVPSPKGVTALSVHREAPYLNAVPPCAVLMASCQESAPISTGGGGEGDGGGGEGLGGGGEGDGGGGEGDGESAPISTGSHCGGIATGWLASASLLATLGLVMCGRKVARKAAATPMRTSTPKLEASFFACIG